VREAQQVLGGPGYQRGSGKGSRVEDISRDVRVIVLGGGSEILIDLASLYCASLFQCTF
jgi:alkylation response protein AidB-like acyl-CoA dehydrogenase